jgi:hypothetical protein
MAYNPISYPIGTSAGQIPALTTLGAIDEEACDGISDCDADRQISANPHSG